MFPVIFAAFFSFCLCSRLPAASSHGIQLISILSYSAPVATSLLNTGAALELATEHANQMLGPNITMSLKLMHGPKNASCLDEEAALADKLAKYYYNNQKYYRCMAIIGASKSYAIMFPDLFKVCS